MVVRGMVVVYAAFVLSPLWIRHRLVSSTHLQCGALRLRFAYAYSFLSQIIFY